MRKVYLAGPISGMTFQGSEEWRDEFKSYIPSGSDIKCFSPLRAKQFLKKKGVIEQSYADNPLSVDRGVMTRDHFDCATSDLVVANFMGVERVSIGTVMEVAWAHSYRKPLILIIEKEGNPHDHPMIREATGFRTESVEEAAYLALTILNP